MKRALLGIVLGALSATTFAAQTEAQAALIAPAPIGRLFYTPAERAQLDIARIQRKPVPQQSSAAAAPVEAPDPPAQVVTYGGIVRRSDGRSMLWINNQLVDEKDALKGLNLKGKVGADGAVTLHVPQTGRSINVKPGQSVEIQTGRVAEARKPEAKPPAEEPRPTTTESAPPPAASPAPAAAAKSTAPESTEKKPAAGAGAGLKLDLGGSASASK